MILATGANCMDILAVKIVLGLFLFFLGLNTLLRLIGNLPSTNIDMSKENRNVVYAVAFLLVSFIYLCLYCVLIWAMRVVNNML